MVLRAPSSHVSVETMTDRVCEAFRELPLQEKTRFGLKLAVHEALSNAVVHGNKNDPSKQVTVTCRCRPHQVTIIVDDEGDGFDPDSVPDPTTEHHLLDEAGRGIFLIRCYVDECRFENQGRRIIIVKRLP